VPAGLPDNPCLGDLSATIVSADGSTSVESVGPAANPAIDCFYVYPTVSRQKGVNATLTVDPEQVAVAKAQAALFSRVCHVYAPIYPQITQAALSNPSLIDAGRRADGLPGRSIGLPGLHGPLTTRAGVWSSSATRRER